MKNYISFALIIFISFTGIAQRNEMKKNNVSVNVDKMTEKETKQINLSTNDLKTFSESSIGLTLKDSAYTLYSFVYKSGWLFVESIMIKIDGKIFEFKSIQDRREIEPQAYISEKNWYTPSNDFIEAFKTAKEISYRLNGKDYYIDYDIKEKKLYIISEFFN